VEEGDEEDSIDYVEGCFGDSEIAYYEQAIPGVEYQVAGNISVEIRHKRDPYIVFAEAHYNLGRDMEIVLWLSGACLLIAFILIVSLGIIMFNLIQNSTTRREQ
jgi:hypothetical protein